MYPVVRIPEKGPTEMVRSKWISLTPSLVQSVRLRLDLDLRILQRGEPALVQALLPEPTVEFLYVEVLKGIDSRN
jgi:hypothetical protein